MKYNKYILGIFIIFFSGLSSLAQQVNRKTVVSIKANQFYLNDELTYKNKYYRGNKIEGLLMNSRMVQGIFDDINPATKNQFIYPDTKTWGADRNTNEFVHAMSDWYKHGLLSFTLNMQGGIPVGYGNKGWINSAFDSTGELRVKYMDRLEGILNKADELGMVVILGYFYFGQDEQLKNEMAVINATDNITKWIGEKGYRNLLIEINNECDIYYDHDILKPNRVDELLIRVKKISKNYSTLLVSTSFSGGTLPVKNVVINADYILLHANGISASTQLKKLISDTQKYYGYFNKPIIINEDDHFNFETDTSNFITAVKSYTSWGYFDYRMKDEKMEDGFQSVPVDWGINSKRKKGFFVKLKEIVSEEKADNQKEKLAQYIGIWYSTNNINDTILGKNPSIKMTVIPKMDSGSLQVEVFKQQKGKWIPLMVELISYDKTTDMIVASGQNEKGECFIGRGYFTKNNDWYMNDVNYKGEPTLAVSFHFINSNEVYLEGTTPDNKGDWKVKYIRVKNR